MPPSAKRSPFLTPILPLLLLILVGLALRLVRLDFQPLWWDEGYSAWFAGNPLGDMVRLTAADIHPPLYYALLHVWSLLLGLSPVSLRLFSLAASLPAIPLAYVLGRDLHSRPVGLIAAALVAINPLAIYYGQEVRMYGLAATFSLAALWTGWRWAQPQAPLRFGVAYTLSLLAGLYTLYTFALLPLAQFLWLLLVTRRRLLPWLLTLAAVFLLYTPWLLYAGPKLLNYVAYKVVQDNDTPLTLLPYLGRHLSAFLVGHLEGPLAPLWPWALLLLLPLAAAFVQRSEVRGQRSEVRGQDHRAVLSAVTVSPRCTQRRHRVTLYLLLCLLIPLAVGFLQQLRTPFIPPRFERILLFATPALWLLVALGFLRLRRASPPAALITALLLLVANSASLAAFYTTPRYPEADYRPLIAEIRRQAAPNDSIFTIFPWQTGYFWSYLPPAERPTIVPAPTDDWTPALQQTLDHRLTQGAVWFPEHLALGAILETAIENYLDQTSYQLLNRWYNEQTRLTAWALPRATEAQDLEAPIIWQNSVSLQTARLGQDDERLFFDLGWAGEQALRPEGLTFSLWLTDPADGYRWAQQDIAPFAQPWPPLDPDQTPWTNSDRIALTIPAGVPPGEYDLWAALVDSTAAPIPLATDEPASQAWLGTITLAPPAPGKIPTPVHPDHETLVSSKGVTFLGHNRPPEPYLPGDDILLSLFWRPHAPHAPDRHIFIQLLDGHGKVAAALEGPPIAWLPTSRWLPNHPIRSQHRLRLPAALPSGQYELIAGLFDPANNQRLAWAGGKDFLHLGKVTIASRQHSYQPPTLQYPLDVTLAGGHRLVGYDLVAGASPGSPVNLTLYWQPAGPTETRYSTFVHLLAPDDAILVQHDAEPAQNALPTTSWLADEFVTDPIVLTLPANAPPGPYRLAFGLYDPATGERLPVVDAQGNALADHIEITYQ